MAALDAEELENMARECRTLASTATHEIVREEILDLAEQFEQLARRQRRLSRQTSSALARSSSARP